MKPGAESDPFDEEPPEEQESDVDTDSDNDETSGHGTMVVSSSRAPTEPPYVLRRSTVKEGRDMVQFFLREEFVDGERDLRRDVEEILDTDVSKTDLREAAYSYAQDHPEEVAEILLEWGYEYR